MKDDEEEEDAVADVHGGPLWLIKALTKIHERLARLEFITKLLQIPLFGLIALVLTGVILAWLSAILKH